MSKKNIQQEIENFLFFSSFSPHMPTKVLNSLTRARWENIIKLGAAFFFLFLVISEKILQKLFRVTRRKLFSKHLCFSDMKDAENKI